ncbi:TPA: hypothetical protein EYN98_29150 [Candidatus Poribacteria bacterium]|nr:hypothetical protein [Candidatus Poribacteria bacterium]HIB90908.1 hypothetical protein [Candidatus Poribacteria bacterium]HIB98212.1 hypothetical protein [Candidatus Poribacteria bacterium]HIC18815.1 hypothetical protein [Candidatus Poribacteria bacterium]HIO79788.1 hypothetical protein [Candidatus Poribacteria bacterium]
MKDIETALQYLSVYSPHGYKARTVAGMFHPTMIDTADGNRMVHLLQRMEIYDPLFSQFTGSRS